MDIQWFPGHMAKTKKKLVEQLRWVDAVLEVADARVPVSSRNPLLQTLVRDKPKIVLLNKADLADKGLTDRWISRLGKEDRVLAISASTGLGMKKIVPQLELLLSGKMQALAAKGVRPRPFRVMVVGIPNTGKSSLINKLASGARALTGNKPGVTRGNQWIRVHERMDLLDTPGLLWPKFDDQETARLLAATGAIRDEVFDTGDLAQWLLEELITYHGREIRRYGGLQEEEEVTMEALGRRRGCLLSKGEIDCGKMARLLLKDFRGGRIARVTLEKC